MFSSQPCKSPQNQPEPSACFLTSIKSSVRHPRKPSFSSSRLPSPSRAEARAGHDRSNALEWDWDLQPKPARQNVERRQTHPSPKSNPGNNNSPTNHQRSPPACQRRGRCGQKKLVSMADYLTLEQLENVSQQQDTRRATQAAATMNNDNPRVQSSLPRAGDAADTQAALPPPLSRRDIYPALRPGPLSRRD